MWLLDSPLTTGVADPNGPWTHADIQEFMLCKRPVGAIRVKVDFGTVDGEGNFIPGTAINGVNPVHHTIKNTPAQRDTDGNAIPGTENPAYDTVVAIAPEEGIGSYYAGVKKEIWTVLAAEGIVGAGTMI